MADNALVKLEFDKDGKLGISVRKDVIEGKKKGKGLLYRYETSETSFPIPILGGNADAGQSLQVDLTPTVALDLPDNVPVNVSVKPHEDPKKRTMRIWILKSIIDGQKPKPVDGYYHYQISAAGSPIRFFNGVDKDGTCYRLKLNIDGSFK